MLSLFDILSDAASLRLSMRGTPKPPLPIATGSTAKTQNAPGKMQHQKKLKSVLFQLWLSGQGRSGFLCLLIFRCLL